MNKELTRLIVEEVTKSEIKNMIIGDRSEVINSKEFKLKVKEISASVIEELYKILWTRKSFWLDPIKK
jgi:hypothetical protein